MDALEGPGVVGTGLPFCDGKLCQRGYRAGGRFTCDGQADGAKQSYRSEGGREHAVDRLLRQPLRRRGQALWLLRSTLEIAPRLPFPFATLNEVVPGLP